MIKEPSKHSSDDRQVHNRLLSEFEKRGVDPRQILNVNFENDLKRINKVMHILLSWLDAYRATPDRATLQKQGFRYPPVEPGINPETDWDKFEKWANNDASRKKQMDLDILSDQELAQLTPEEVTQALDKLLKGLASKNVVLDFEDALPDRLLYHEIVESLREEPLTKTSPSMQQRVLGGCNSYCPECVRRPWCEDGNTMFPEDEDAGRIVYPEQTKHYVSPAPGSLALLEQI
jgi:hypothetical protein